MEFNTHYKVEYLDKVIMSRTTVHFFDERCGAYCVVALINRNNYMPIVFRTWIVPNTGVELALDVESFRNSRARIGAVQLARALRVELMGRNKAINEINCKVRITDFTKSCLTDRRPWWQKHLPAEFIEYIEDSVEEWR